MKNVIYLSMVALLALNIGCTAEPVTTQEDEKAFEKAIKELEENSIENEEVKDSDI